MSREDEAIGTDVEAAGRLISACISRDIAANFDLEESLEASRYASHPYSSHPKEWPPLAEVVDTRELPAVLIERYNTAGGEGTALCGIFPEIRRAWASVDNSLFLWRFDKWDGQCPEYSGEEEAICAVGLVKSRPGIFVEAIQYLLVLATPLEVILLGVCCSGRGDGTDPYAELSLQPLPEYTVPSGGVTMTCITCTNNGRVFLAGRDGHIYEMQYTSGSGWHKRCRIVCLTGGVWSNISRWVSSTGFNFGAVDPIVGMVIDNNRYILYARTQASKIQVFDLGVNGDGSPKKIAEERNLIDHRDAQYGSGRFASSRPVSRAAKPSVVCIIPLSPLESKWLHIIAVLSDGRRMYLSTAPSGGNNNSVGALTGLGSTLRRPCTLKLVTTRAPPSVGVGGGITFGALSVGGRSQSDDLALKIETAYYSAGVLFLSDSSPTTVSSLLIVNMDLTTSSSLSSNFGMSARTPALRESVSSLPVEGRTLCVDDILPLPELAAAVQSLYSDSFGIETLKESCEKACVELRARGELVIQHILPRRRVVVFSTMGVMEIVFNRPVDILRRLLESSLPRSLLEEFFNRFGAGEAAAMCLMLAAKLVSVEETLVSNTVAEKAAESFEDPRLVGTPQVGGSSALSNTITPPGVGFNMGMVVQEAEPVFSGAHEGLCLCSSRLLFPVWEQPVFVIKGKAGDEAGSEGVIVCRLSIEAMQVLESKVRSLEQFLRSRRDQRRGLYGRIAGLGDVTGSILYGSVSDIGIGERSVGRNLFGTYGRNIDSGNGTSSSKRQRLPYSPPELAAMEVRAMECVRRLLRRSGEALFLLQLLSQHHVTRLIQRLDIDLRHKLVNLTFQQLVCSEEGDQLAMSLISGLVEYYVGPEGRGTVDDISARLRGGCPSYYNDNDYKFFQAVDCLEKAAVTIDPEEKEKLAREAFSLLTKVPESADLRTVCKRFEDLRFYEAVVRLPLQKAQALDPEGDALNDQIDVSRRENALALRMQCYEIVTDVLRSLNGEARQNAPQREFKTSTRISGSQPALDQASRKRYIRQIVQLSVQWPDRVFREHLYRTMIDIGLENELLEFGGSDLVPFLLSATQEPISQVGAVSGITSTVPITSHHVKYLELLAGYYVTKRQHVLAAHLLLRLAERRYTDEGGNFTLKQRHEYLSKAVIQAKNASNINGAVGSGQGAFDNGLLELLEGKLSVLYFQIKIKEQLEFLASSLEDSASAPSNETHPGDPFPPRNLMSDANLARNARDKGREISLDLKSITQLYNEYAVPFKLWEICLEILHFADHAGDADSSIIRETWARLLDQALSRGGIAEACSVLKRVGSQLYPGEGASLPLDTICLHLEKAALERSISGAELVGDEDVARALIAACKGATEPLLATYDQLLSNRAILASSDLRLRLLRSVLVILREWSMSLLAQRMGTSPAGVSLILGGALTLEQTPVLNQGVRDKITSASNRYMTEVRRLALPQSQTADVYEGFRELEKTLLVPFSF